MRAFFDGGGAIVVLVVFPLLLAAVAALRLAAGVRAVAPSRSTAALPFLATSEKRARRPVVGCAVAVAEDTLLLLLLLLALGVLAFFQTDVKMAPKPRPRRGVVAPSRVGRSSRDSS